MFKDITIGQYVEGNSFIHKMDARVKILLSLFYIIILFLISSPVAYAVFTAFTLFLVYLSKVPPKFILRGLKPMMYILVFTAVLNLFMTQGSTVLWVCPFWSTLKITKEGLTTAELMIL